MSIAVARRQSKSAGMLAISTRNSVTMADMTDKMTARTTTDLQLLALLRQTPVRASPSSLTSWGYRGAPSRTAIARMEDAGIIVGYTVRLRPDAQPEQIARLDQHRS